MNENIQSRLQQWRSFQEWEHTHPRRLESRIALRMAGEWVDFYLTKHRSSLLNHPADVGGIQKMHQALSCLSSAS